MEDVSAVTGPRNAAKHQIRVVSLADGLDVRLDSTDHAKPKFSLQRVFRLALSRVGVLRLLAAECRILPHRIRVGLKMRVEIRDLPMLPEELAAEQRRFCGPRNYASSGKFVGE